MIQYDAMQSITFTATIEHPVLGTHFVTTTLDKKQCSDHERGADTSPLPHVWQEWCSDAGDISFVCLPNPGEPADV